MLFIMLPPMNVMTMALLFILILLYVHINILQTDVPKIF
jgi:hypothetical protein